MPKVKIKISDIQNLTDARYFAAMDVDYLGFCCNPGTETYCSITKIKEIISWVEGPKYVLQFQGFQNEDDISEIVDSGLGQALHFGVFATYDRDFGIPVFKEWIFENITIDEYNRFDFPIVKSDIPWHEFTDTDKSKLVNLLDQKFGYIDLRWRNEDLLDMIEFLPSCGLILRGGNEERIGVKSYDDLDVVFDILSDLAMN